ncbi:tripartite motif-containing protein 16-like protein [Xyrauchen texanus]|uniref:tripartite motif-containing protein 16-like protein n=1 Tax=Xyrauchen texanus TaxID=154827 RepID=UPI002242B2DA|nr:tripartite motif-containing protein 16-like protein [Xyrauchen texanus]
MAETNISVAQDQFCCPVCLDLLKDPVGLACGHSYCMSCITDCWDQEDKEGVGLYSCPQCRQTFTPRPVLNKNTILAEMVEKLKKPKLKGTVLSQCYAGPGDVDCNVCTEGKNKAVKSCLVCLNSYCQNHLELHDDFFKEKRHDLIDATGRLQEMICFEHKRLLEVFCRTDQQCICMMCMMDKHKNHDTETAATERHNLQRQLVETQSLFKQRIQQREKELQGLREAVESHKRSAQTAVEDSERIYTELIRSIERCRSEVTQLIRAQEKAAVIQAEGVFKQLELEIADLKRRQDELEQLSNTNDDIHFLQSVQSFSVLPESTVLPSISSLLTFDNVGKSVSLLRDKLEDFCKEVMEKIACRVSCIQIISAPDPTTREEFLQYSCQLSLDPNTVHNLLCLSKDNTAVTNTRKVQKYPDHPHRFDYWAQVLCRESLCGRCYWEVEWSGSKDGWVGISVSYKGISRKGMGDECVFGCNNQSWRLNCLHSTYSSCHDSIKTAIPVSSSSSKIGVYVDYSAGTLSFYSVSDTLTLIHRVHTTFTQPLYPGFRVYDGSTVKLCDLRKELKQ